MMVRGAAGVIGVSLPSDLCLLQRPLQDQGSSHTLGLSKLIKMLKSC